MISNILRFKDKLSGFNPIDGLVADPKESKIDIMARKQAVALIHKSQNAAKIINQSVDSLKRQGVDDKSINKILGVANDKKARIIQKKVLNNEKVSNAQMKFLVDNTEKLSTSINELGSTLEVSLGTVVNNTKDLVNESSLGSEDIKDTLKASINTIQVELDKTGSVDEKSQNLLEDLARFTKEGIVINKQERTKLSSILGELSDRTEEIKIRGTFDSMNDKLGQQLMSTEELQNTLEASNADGVSFREFMEKNASKISGDKIGLIDTIGSSLGLGGLGNTIRGLSSAGGAVLGGLSSLKNFGSVGAGLINKMGTAAKSLGGLGGMASKLGSAGLVAAAGFAGFKFGEWLMNTKFGQALSDKGSDMALSIVDSAKGFLHDKLGIGEGSVKDRTDKKLNQVQKRVAERRKKNLISINEKRKSQGLSEFKTFDEFKKDRRARRNSIRQGTSNRAVPSINSKELKKKETPIIVNTPPQQSQSNSNTPVKVINKSRGIDDVSLILIDKQGA